MNGLKYISRVVNIGNVPMGGEFPIRIQSMTTTNTLDTMATVKQAIRMIKAGCEYVRITAQGVKEAKNLSAIKEELKKRGYTTPLIADIHYNPKAAEAAAKIVEKVRINPGNYTDRKTGKRSYSESEYDFEIEKIRNRMRPLISICKQHGTAVRIGSNHGSLSDRIMLRYGDTPAGMVESALEFVKICRDFDFHNLVLSMKASNVKVMVHANRLLVKRMLEEGMDYPVHLGVTEAGDAEEGRIKSAAGIGTLLDEAIGDTIRVSLTEDPEFEIPVAKSIVSRFQNPDKRNIITGTIDELTNPFSFSRRKTLQVEKIGNGRVPVVILTSQYPDFLTSSFEKNVLPDYVFDDETGKLYGLTASIENQAIESCLIKVKFIESEKDINAIDSQLPDETALFLKTEEKSFLGELRKILSRLNYKGIRQPIVVFRDYSTLKPEEILVQATIDFSGFLIDGLIDGIWISHTKMPLTDLSRLAFGILQATSSRITKTEYIACPSCGRTLFNIQGTLQKIKSRTSHLKGLKIGVMGCCVNGPGEMADADYGYVGSGKGKISLYKGRQIIQGGIHEQDAIEALVSLIKLNGDWK